MAKRRGSTRLYLSSGIEHLMISLTMTPTTKVAKLVKALYHINDIYNITEEKKFPQCLCKFAPNKTKRFFSVKTMKNISDINII